MYLLPTDEDLKYLYRQIDPKQRFLEAAWMAIDEMTKDSMPYFDDIEDDIISMRRDVNGFKFSRPRYMEHNPNSGHLNFKGWSFEDKRDEEFEKQLFNESYVESVSSWDEI